MVEIDYQPWKEYTGKVVGFRHFIDMFREQKEKKEKEWKKEQK